MMYGIIRLQKVKAAAVHAMQYHNDREAGAHDNPDIDPSRTPLNQSWVEHGDYSAEISSRIESGRTSTRKVRKDAVVLVEGIVTASPEFFDKASPKEVEAFKSEAFDFVKAEFGESNLVHFDWHLDETTLHAHFGVVPLKDGSLSWKKFFPDKSALSRFQDRFFEKVGSRHGLARGEKRADGTPAKRHKSVRDKKAEVLREVGEADAHLVETRGKIGALDEEIAKKAALAAELDSQISEKSARLESVQGEIERFTEKSEAREAELERLKGEKRFEVGRGRGLEVAAGQLAREVAELARAVAAAARAVLEGLPRTVLEAPERAVVAFERFREYFATEVGEEAEEWVPDPYYAQATGLDAVMALKSMESEHVNGERRAAHGHVTDHQAR